MFALQLGGTGQFLLFVVLPGLALGAAMALSLYEVYRIGERKLLIVLVILALMFQHQLLEAMSFLRTGENVAEGFGEVFETGANLVASGSVYYVLRFARRERRLAEELEQSERQYRNLVEEAPVPVLLHGSQEIQYANDAAVEMLDAEDRSAVTGPPLASFLPPEESQRVRETVLTDGGTETVETRVQTLADGTRHVILAGAPADYEGDDATQVVVQDLTERKRRERELRVERDRRSMLFENNPDPVVEIEFENDRPRIEEVNGSFEDLFGFDSEGIGGRTIGDALVPAADRDEYERLLERTRQGDTVETEVHRETERGLREFLLRIIPFELGDGTRRAYVWYTDITDRRELERTYRTVFENVSDGLVIHDAETGEIVDVNDRFCEMNGYVRDDLIGEPLDVVTGPDHAYETVQDHIQRAREGDRQLFESRNQRKDGTTFPVEVHLSGVRIRGEERVLASVRDITQRKRREREYEQIFHGVNDAIGIFDPDTYELVEVNDRMCELTGYERETILQEDLVLSVTDEGYDRDRIADLIDEVIETGESSELEWLVETADGERRWLDVSATPATINGQQRLLTISRDVTERRRVERRLRAILDRIDEAIYFTRADELATSSYHPDDLSAGHEDIWGRPLEEVYERYDEGISGTVHPDERAEFKAFIERIGQDVDDKVVSDRYSREYRIEHPDGETRWVRSDFYPTEWGSGSLRLVVVSRDITERKARERRIASFDEATDDLVTADTPEEATRSAVEAATETLGLPAVGVFLYDSDAGVLRPEVLTGPLSDCVETDEIGPEDGPLWEAFASGTLVASDGGVTEEEFYDEESGGPADLAALEEWRGLVLGNHGILVVGSPDSTFGPDTIQATHVLAATLEAALNHLESQRQIADREERLQTQTERAERLERIADLTQRVESAITEASEPAEVERAVCDRLISSGPYDLAWVGRVPVSAEEISPGTVVGASSRYVEALDLRASETGTDAHPAVRAWRTDSVQVADSIVRDGLAGDWRQRALTEGYQSLCAVPLTYDGITHGVLTVGSESPSAFGERERDVLEQLGSSIGYALAAIERRRALESDDTVELEFSGTGVDLRFARAARETGCEIRHERTVRREDGTVSVYYSVTGDVPDDLEDTVGEILPGDVGTVSDGDSSTVVESRSDDWFGSPLAEYGAVLREASATADGTHLAVEVPSGADVRSFVDRLQEIAPSLELVAKRQQQRREHTASELTGVIEEELTDRQVEAVRTALSAGYFEWPRRKDGSEVADMLDITQPTLNKHLRTAERKTFQMLFDADDVDA